MSCAGAQLIAHLIFVRDIVHQPGVERVLREERPFVDQPADLALVLLPSVGDIADDLFVQIAVQRLVHLLVRGREAFLGERVRRGLVVADVMEVGDRAELVEGAAQEELVCRHALQIERRRRHEEYFVRRRREVILAVAAELEIGVHRLPRFLELDDGVANLLHFSPERRIESGRLEQHAADARVDFRFSQVVDNGAHRGGSDAAEVADDVGGGDLREIAADAQHERCAGGDGRFAAEEHVEHREAGDGDDTRDAQQCENDGESAAGHSNLSGGGRPGGRRHPSIALRRLGRGVRTTRLPPVRYRGLRDLYEASASRRMRIAWVGPSDSMISTRLPSSVL
jgi:hypothetical protein